MSSEVLKGYKVVKTDGYTLLSCIQKKGKGEIHYKKNEWIDRKEGEGPLAVFNELRCAKVFVAANINYIPSNYKFLICECIYIPSNDKDLWFTYLKSSECPSENYGLPLDYGGIIIDETETREIREAYHLPAGTKLANKVKLLREVLESEE